MTNKEILEILKGDSSVQKRDVLRTLSFGKLKKLYSLDKNVIKYISSSDNNINLLTYALESFTSDEVKSFYEYFYREINNLSDDDFVFGFENIAYFYADKFLDEQGEDVNSHVEIRKHGNKFLKYIFERYEKKLSNMKSPSVLLHLLVNMLDRGLDKDTMERFISNNEDEIRMAINMCDVSRLFDLFEGLDSECQKILLTRYYSDISNHVGFKSLYNCLHDDVLVYLYEMDNSILSKIDMRHYLRAKLNDEKKTILSKYKVEDLKNVFDPSSWGPIDNIKYIEKFFRSSIVCDGKISDIDESTELFSYDYLKNLKEMKIMMDKREIMRNSAVYKEHFKIFYKYLITSKHLGELNETEIKEVEKFFFRVVRGGELWPVKQINSINMITLVNRVSVVDTFANNFSVEQLLRYNVKEHKKLCEMVRKNNPDYKYIVDADVLKLMIVVGYERAKYILEIDSDVETLHHLVGGMNVKNIKLDEKGNPLVDNKFISLLFKDKDHNRVKLMLENKDGDLYKYFPRIINEWEIIKLSNKNKTLKEVIEFLKNGGVVVPPKYYRLENYFNLIGRSSEVVLEAFRLHDEMLKRIETTIPRVKGEINGYEYEVLRYDDMECLTVGNATDCCFTVKGVSQTSLRHALTSKNGRILVVKKNGELLAHSWLWRNGNVLCLDNIEISKKIKKIEFLEVYEKFANQILEASHECEGKNKCIDNILVGGDRTASKYVGIEKYPCYIIAEDNFSNSRNINYKFVSKLPVPIEAGLYSDAKMSQWLIRGNGDFSFYQSKFGYMDERKAIFEYDKSKKNKWEFIRFLNKKITPLKMVKDGKEEGVKFEASYYDKVYCSDDWYIAVDGKGNVEKFCLSNDFRAKEEMDKIVISLRENCRK